MNVGAFTLRDYVLYLFPGMALILCGALVYPEMWETAKESPILTSLGFLTLGYVAGFAGRQLALFLFKPALKRILGNPLRRAVVLKKGLRSVVEEELTKNWPEPVLADEETSILFLCAREIETTEHQGLRDLERLTSLYGLALNLMLPALLMTIILTSKGDYILAILSSVVLAALVRGHHRYRKAFARNVYRIWYIQKRQQREDNAENNETKE